MPLTEHLSWEVVSEGEGKAAWNAKKGCSFTKENRYL